MIYMAAMWVGIETTKRTYILFQILSRLVIEVLRLTSIINFVSIEKIDFVRYIFKLNNL